MAKIPAPPLTIPAGESKTAGDPLHDVLRVSPEPYRYYTEAQVHELLTKRPGEYVDYMKKTLVAIATGRAQLTLPPKQVFHDPTTHGDFRVMPCELRHGHEVMKTVKLIGTNTVQRKVPDQITVGKVFVLHPEENFVSAVLEACLLSSARTGVCAALAIASLSRARKRLVVVGSGRVGFYAALYAVVAAGAEHVIFCDIVHRRAQQAAQWFTAIFPSVQSEAQPVSAVTSADVVVLATTSTTPVASPPCWGANLIISLGADTDRQSELDPAWSRLAEPYCDTLDSLRFGDLRAWIESGLIDATTVSDFLEVLRNPPPESGRPRIFISTGSALFDNITVCYLFACEGSQQISA